MTIDAHQHFWNMDKVSYPWLVPEYGVLYRNYLPDELEPLLAESQVDKTVLVQSANSFEDTDFMLELSNTSHTVAGVVGWVPLDNPDMTALKLAHYTKFPVFKGIRHLIHEETDPDWLIRPRVIDGLRILEQQGLTFDIVAVYPNHLHHVPYLCQKLPDLNIVLDHLGKPPQDKENLKQWAILLANAAQSPRVHAKISGLSTRGEHPQCTAEYFRPVFDIAMECFGSRRLMFGSDWPVVNLAGSYRDYFLEMGKILNTLNKYESEDVLAGTATAFYRL